MHLGQILGRSLFVLPSLVLAITLGACGGGSEGVSVIATTEPTSSPPFSLPPSVSITLPDTIPINQTVRIPAGAVSAITPAGLASGVALRVDIFLGSIRVAEQTYTAERVGCVPGALRCSSVSFDLIISDQAFPATYTLVVTVFDRLGRSASDSTSLTLS
jgi:hypothetical protein